MILVVAADEGNRFSAYLYKVSLDPSIFANMDAGSPIEPDVGILLKPFPQKVLLTTISLQTLLGLPVPLGVQ